MPARSPEKGYIRFDVAGFRPRLFLVLTAAYRPNGMDLERTGSKPMQQIGSALRICDSIPDTAQPIAAHHVNLVVNAVNPVNPQENAFEKSP